MAHMSGRRIVEMTGEALDLCKILTREAFENAIKVNAAIGVLPTLLSIYSPLLVE